MSPVSRGQQRAFSRILSLSKMAKKRGKIKYADPERGYGYILAEDTDDPTKTIIFEAKDAESEIEEFVEGTEVLFEVEEDAAKATSVKTA
jgi:cold shock CspA family protein